MTDEHELVARGKQLAESGQYAPSTTAVNSNGHVAEDIPPEVVYPAEEISRPELVDNNISGWTAELLDDVDGFVGRFIVHPSEHERRAHVLWIAHAWLMDCWESTPRIAFLSPEPGSGKSRALEVTEPLVPRPVHTVNTTSAYLFRKVADPTGRPTILFDEIDTVFGPKAKEHEEIRGLINAGHRQGAQAGRCVVRGKEVFTEELEAYCAVALAGLDDLPDTIMTRSIVVRMRRRADDERVESWRPDSSSLRRRSSTPGWRSGRPPRVNISAETSGGLTCPTVWRTATPTCGKPCLLSLIWPGSGGQKKRV